jgi:hypothetical protein
VVLLALTASFAPARPTAAITWTSPVKISSDSATSNLPQCLVGGDSIYLVWFGIDELLQLSQDGVQFSRSTDGGAAFSPPVTLLPFDVCLNAPRAARAGATLYITVAAVIDTSYGAFLLRSTDAGAHWEPPRLLQGAVFPTLVAAEDSLVFVHFVDPVTQVHGMLRSADGGATWTTAAELMPELSDMLVRDGVLHAVGPTSSRILHEIGYYESDNLGTSWRGPDILSSEDVTKSERASLSMNDRGDLFAVWSDTGDVVVRASKNHGIFWAPQIVLSQGVGTATIDVAAGKEFVSVVWDRDVSGTGEVRMRSSNDFGVTYAPAENPVNGESAAEPFITITGNSIHMTWHEHVNGACEVYYRRGSMEDNPDIVTRPPTSFLLRQNYPNPFNGTTRFQYNLPVQTRVTLTVYNILGEVVAVLVDAEQPEGRYSATLDGDGLPSGTYFYRLRTDAFTETKKLTVVR